MQAIEREDYNLSSPNVLIECKLSGNLSDRDAARQLQSRLSDQCTSCPKLAFYDEALGQCVSFEDRSVSYASLFPQIILAFCAFGLCPFDPSTDCWHFS